MNNKLYVIVRKDLKLSTSQEAVQAGHAVAEYLLRGPKSIWENGTLVYLKIDTGLELAEIVMTLATNNIPYVTFVEPDIGNRVTALATVADPKYFKELNLL